jgi:hypothetical protein
VGKGKPRRGATFDVVVPTTGGPSLAAALTALASGSGPLPERVILVDERITPGSDLRLDTPPLFFDRLVVVNSEGSGPAASRNLGARCAVADWIAFIDERPPLPLRWREALAARLNRAGDALAARCRSRVAYRRDAFLRSGGFDERLRVERGAAHPKKSTNLLHS